MTLQGERREPSAEMRPLVQIIRGRVKTKNIRIHSQLRRVGGTFPQKDPDLLTSQVRSTPQVSQGKISKVIQKQFFFLVTEA